jgi:acetoacetyl-[acyl-carrier protein] synthase
MTQSLPVIVGFGGYNAAGRSSSHQAFRRMVLESLPSAEQCKTIVGLACLMGHVQMQGEQYSDQQGRRLSAEQVDQEFRTEVLDGTLVRRVEHFDPGGGAGQ